MPTEIVCASSRDQIFPAMGAISINADEARVAIVVVGGSTKDIGKTSLVCALISALRDFEWTAVKITGHSYEPRLSASSSEQESTGAIVWEETEAGQATDTSRYLAAGARRALLVTSRQEDIPIQEIHRAISQDRNIVFESNRIIDVLEADICIALVGGSEEKKPSFVRLLNKADALVTLDGLPVDSADLGADIQRFTLKSLDQLSAGMVTWMRTRLGLVHDPL
jgi:hypothetical protein